MAAALLTGSQTGIDRDVMEAMRASGLSHLLSISGVHVSMIALLIYLPLAFFWPVFSWIALRWPIKKIAAAAALFGTTFTRSLVDQIRDRALRPDDRDRYGAVIADRKALVCALSRWPLFHYACRAQRSYRPQLSNVVRGCSGDVSAYEKRLDAALKEGFSFELPSGSRIFGGMRGILS